MFWYGLRCGFLDYWYYGGYFYHDVGYVIQSF